MRLELIRDIMSHEEKTYIEVPFTVPEHVERLSVSMKVEYLAGDAPPKIRSAPDTNVVSPATAAKPSANRFGIRLPSPKTTIVDLGIRDSAGMRGWSGGARSFFEIGPEEATPGYLPGEVTAGEWKVLLGAYRIPAAGCRVILEVQLAEAPGRWLKGELHAHTNHSDGHYSLPEAIKLAEQAGLDFLALTDHNTASQNLARHRLETDLTLIPAMELTTLSGHCNLYGLEAPISDFRSLHPEDTIQLLTSAKERGAYISLNHPHCSNCGWTWGFDVPHDWVEVWNGPWREDNLRTLVWWQEQLEAGRRLTAVGGSDFHRPHPYIRHGSPCNWIFAHGRSVDAILRAVDRGRVTLSHSPEGPRLTISIGQWGMGDVVPAALAEGMWLDVQASGGLLRGDVLRVYSANGLEEERILDGGAGDGNGDGNGASDWIRTGPGKGSGDVAGLGGNNGTLLKLVSHNRLFYRAELWRYAEEAGGLSMIAMTNPIYLSAQ
ncbi:CehA/McbA family metallohydrolase [Paenibacillus mesotrionivorans]|uniref:CehA/McbA family metallohydrolase n=1 Tax=Paenibacillus mesotrionivorans TaxID=3160968 RepID=A0ACC7NRP9_9BACL